jgi:hypothetical protein
MRSITQRIFVFDLTRTITQREMVLTGSHSMGYILWASNISLQSFYVVWPGSSEQFQQQYLRR